MIASRAKTMCLVTLLIVFGGLPPPERHAHSPYPSASDAAGDPARSAGPAAGMRIQLLKRVPFNFEPNFGQTDKRVKFISRGDSYNLFLTQGETVLVADTHNPNTALSADASGNSIRQTAVRIKFIGAAPAPALIGSNQLPAVSNYLIGNDGSAWHTNIPHYQKVQYRELYPGIDLVFYGNQEQLEFDFILAPGADPNVVRLSLEGADEIKQDSDQGIVLKIGTRKIRLLRPQIFQLRDGIREAVAGNYKISGGQVSFAVGRYDAQNTLIIDPVIDFSTYLGGRKDDYANAIALDDFGYAYIAGTTSSTDFPITPGVFQVKPKSRANAFVIKIDPATSTLIYTTYLGGGQDDTGLGVAVDGTGEVYVTGTTKSKDFPISPGALQPSLRGNADAFVTKLNAMANGLIYSTYLGGSCRSGSTATDVPAGIRTDSSGHAYVAGYTYCRDFPTTLGAYQISFAGGGVDAFVAKLNPTGSALIYSTYLGGQYSDYGNGIALDREGNVYVTGATDSTNFPTTAGAFQGTRAGGTDAFVTKLNAAGSGLLYSTYLGGKKSGKDIFGSKLPGFDWAEAIAVDDFGNAYVTGETDSQDFPILVGATQTIYGGGSSDAFVAKLAADGTLIYCTYLGGRSSGGISGEAGLGIAADLAGNAYVTGHTNASDFPITADAFQVSYRGNTDAFVVKITPDGSSLIYSSYLGGRGADHGHGVAVDLFGNAFVAGATNSQDFPTLNPNQAARRGSNDAFLVKISE